MDTEAGFRRNSDHLNLIKRRNAILAGPASKNLSNIDSAAAEISMWPGFDADPADIR